MTDATTSERSDGLDFTPLGIPRELKPAFQEYDIEKLDPDRDAFTVIERTLAHGSQEELHWLFTRYGAARLAEWLREAGWRLLPRERLLFWATYFQLTNLPQRKNIWPY